MKQLHAVIMAGGSGTRFWPASRKGRPKQFLPLVGGGQTLIGATIARLEGLIPAEQIWVITNAEQAELLRQTEPSFDPSRILVEPEARDTAPCIALAAARIGANHPDAVLCMLPADHHIDPVSEFQRSIARAAQLAAERPDTLVTLGLRPDRPATGYGYIEPGDRLDADAPAACSVARFREKPDLATAEQFLAEGRMLWNAGIFVWTLPGLQQAMEVGSPELAELTTQMTDAARDGREADVTAAFRSTPKISIDYAVMEKAPRVAVVEASFGWDDLGSFLALERLSGSDSAGNSVHGADTESSRVLLRDSKDSLVYSDGSCSISLLGVDNLVVVQTGDAVLVCPRDRVEDIKQLQGELSERGWTDLL